MTAPTEPATLTDSASTVRTLFFLRGLFAVLFGVVILIWPGITLWALVVAFGVYTIADGVVLVFQSVVHHRETPGWGMLFVSGLLSVAIGVIALLWPQITVLAAFYLVAFYALLFGMLGIVSAVQHSQSRNRTSAMASGLLAVILGVLLLIFPESGISVLWILLGVWSILFGLMLMVLGNRIGNLPARLGLR